MGLQIDGGPVWLEHRGERIGDLLPDAFLHCKAPGEQPHEAGELGNADDVLVCDVSDIRLPVKGQRVVLTDPDKGDRPLNDLTQGAVRPTATLGLKHGEQFGIALIAFGGIKQSLQKPSWRFLSRWCMQVEPKGRKDFGQITLEHLHLLM